MAQWAATPAGSMARLLFSTGSVHGSVCIAVCSKLRFEFLKAFMLDKDGLATIEVQPYYEEIRGCI